MEGEANATNAASHGRNEVDELVAVGLPVGVSGVSTGLPAEIPIGVPSEVGGDAGDYNSCFLFASQPDATQAPVLGVGPNEAAGRVEIRGVAPVADATSIPTGIPECAFDLPTPNIFSQPFTCTQADPFANCDVFMLPPREETEEQLRRAIEAKASHFIEAAIELERRFPSFPREMSVATMKLRASQTMQRFRGRWDWKRRRVVQSIPFFVAVNLLTRAWDLKMPFEANEDE